MRRNQLKLEADGYTYRPVGGPVFIVTTPEDRDYRVDLVRGECSCPSFFCGRRPCKHPEFFKKLRAMETGNSFALSSQICATWVHKEP